MYGSMLYGEYIPGRHTREVYQRGTYQGITREVYKEVSHLGIPRVCKEVSHLGILRV